MSKCCWACVTLTRLPFPSMQRLKFVSRERKLVPRPPFYRPPIYFPDVSLQMLRLNDEQIQQVKETGWLREVAFKTTPNVTKVCMEPGDCGDVLACCFPTIPPSRPPRLT